MEFSLLFIFCVLALMPESLGACAGKFVRSYRKHRDAEG